MRREDRIAQGRVREYKGGSTREKLQGVPRGCKQKGAGGAWVTSHLPHGVLLERRQAQARHAHAGLGMGLGLAPCRLLRFLLLLQLGAPHHLLVRQAPLQRLGRRTRGREGGGGAGRHEEERAHEEGNRHEHLEGVRGTRGQAASGCFFFHVQGGWASTVRAAGASGRGTRTSTPRVPACAVSSCLCAVSPSRALCPRVCVPPR